MDQSVKANTLYIPGSAPSNNSSEWKTLYVSDGVEKTITLTGSGSNKEAGVEWQTLPDGTFTAKFDTPITALWYGVSE